jgi:hypothetical protein
VKIRLLESAKSDLKEGYYFYEVQNQGLGNYFLESLFSDIESLKIYAGIHSTHFGQYHRLLSKRFPFAVYYLIEGQNIDVYAVIDCRRDPAWIRKKIAIKNRIS